MEEDRRKREERMRVFNSAVSLLSGGIANWEAQKEIDIGRTLSEGVVPERSLLDKIGIGLTGPTGDPTGKFKAIGSSAGNQSQLERLLEMFGDKGVNWDFTTRPSPLPPTSFPTGTRAGIWNWILNYRWSAARWL